MANEIYANSWWGNTLKTASTLVQNPPLPNLEAFKIRVQSDSGIFEDSSCIFSVTSVNPMLFDSVFIYQNRVLNNGGVIEDTNCLSNKIHNIANL